ncbi:hypothetical protein ACQ4PT_064786 [Festuca glaucescens]
MEGRGVADAATDAKIGAVIGADGVESSVGAHGGAAGGSAAVVAMADLEVQKDLPVGDAPLPDLELKKAGDAVSDVKGDMQAVEDAMEVDPVVHQEEDEKQYDSTESAETVDRRNVGCFTRKMLAQLRGGNLRYVKRGCYSCPWHPIKPRCGNMRNLAQHAREFARSESSQRVRAQHEALLVVLEEKAEA